MNRSITRLVFVLSVLMISLTSNSTSAVSLYALSGQTGDHIAMDISYMGTAPENSTLPYRWYWSYDNRFPIEFEATVGSTDISDGSDWQAVSRALNTWEAVPNASITSSLNSFDGDWGALNGDNELGWIESGWTSKGAVRRAGLQTLLWSACLRRRREKVQA